jgi:hypothetical protein
VDFVLFLAFQTTGTRPGWRLGNPSGNGKLNLASNLLEVTMVVVRRFSCTLLSMALLWVLAAGAPVASAQNSGVDCAPSIVASSVSGGYDRLACYNDDRRWSIDFYSDPELTDWVGFAKCSCWSGYMEYGQVTPYYKVASEQGCGWPYR